MMKSWVKSLELFKDYTKQRLNQPESERQVYFRRALISTFDELTEYFGKIEVLINEHNSGLGTPRIQ